ncbi:MAG: putative DNA binding domain-containing protein [Succinivibrio sp.]|nr:putative DNA binding domain-containing protein [Succinivibrio sp.]
MLYNNELTKKLLSLKELHDPDEDPFDEFAYCATQELVDTKNPESWCKHICGFANSLGGYLIFGISEQREEVVGLSSPRDDAEIITRLITDNIDPLPDYELRFATLDRRDLIIVRVKRGPFTPYYYVGGRGHTAYERLNALITQTCFNMNRLLLPFHTKTYDSQSSQYKLTDLTCTKLRSVYFQRVHVRLNDSDLVYFGLVNRKRHLTYAGLLFSDEPPLPQSRLVCTHWSGLDKAAGLQEAFDHAEYSGNLISLLQEGVAFIKRNSRKGWCKTPDGRIDLPDYPEDAATEGLLNALIHRDYAKKSRAIHLDLFEDRLEICSPGGIYEDYDPWDDDCDEEDWDFPHAPSYRRNPIIADVFQRLNYIARRGKGLAAICEDYAYQQKYRPEVAPRFAPREDNFLLTLCNLNHVPGNGSGNGQGNGQNTPRTADAERAERVVEYLRGNPRSSINKLAQELGLSRKQTVTTLDYLKEQDRLHFVGTNRNGRWVVT